MILRNGESYTGGYKQGKKHGKGEEEWKDGSREIANYVNGVKEGTAWYFDENGKAKFKFY